MFLVLFMMYPPNHQLLLSGSEIIGMKTTIPQEICYTDDELKAFYHSKDSVCIWVFKTRGDRNRFMDETDGER